MKQGADFLINFQKIGSLIEKKIVYLTLEKR